MAATSRPEAMIEPARAKEALELFFTIAEKWDLSIDDQISLLGSPARSTFFKWKKEGGHLPSDTLDRLSHVFGIFKALEILYPDPAVSDAWFRRPNRAFGGESALEHAIAGRLAGLYEIRRYLDAQRGG